MVARTRIAAAFAAGAVVLTAAPALAAPTPTPSDAGFTACSTRSAFNSASQTLSTNPEVASLQSMLPALNTWQLAVAKKDVEASEAAAIKYELVWQGPEVYPNHRSLPLYVAMEPDTQFKLEDTVEAATVDWTLACTLAKRLGMLVDQAINLSNASPALTPIFQDLVKVRTVRANLNQARNFLTTGDLPTAKKYIADFAAGYPSVQPLIQARSQRAVNQIAATYAPLAAELNNPAATVATVQPLFLTWQARVGQGVNLINAAARAADVHRTVVTAADTQNLANLKAVWDGVLAGQAAIGRDAAAAARGGDTGPTSAFARVEAALEAQGRYIAVAPALRTALNNFATAARTATSPTSAAVVTAVEAVRDQIEIDQQDLVGMFWSTLAGTPVVITV